MMIDCSLAIRKFDSAPAGLCTVSPARSSSASSGRIPDSISLIHASAAGDLFIQSFDLTDEDELRLHSSTKTTPSPASIVRPEVRLVERDLRQPAAETLSNHSYADLDGLFRYMIAPLRDRDDGRANMDADEATKLRDTKMQINEWRRANIIEALKEYLDVPRTRFETLEWLTQRYRKFFTKEKARAFLQELMDASDAPNPNQLANPTFMRIYALKNHQMKFPTNNNSISSFSMSQPMQPFQNTQQQKPDDDRMDEDGSNNGDDADGMKTNKKRREDQGLLNAAQVDPLLQEDFQVVLYCRPFMRFTQDDPYDTEDAEEEPLDPNQLRFVPSRCAARPVTTFGLGTYL
jgi:hypothetical protein